MAVDLKYLSEHYASLSDEALAEVNRAELVKEAQQCYDEEVARRDNADSSVSKTHEGLDKPDWLEEGAEVLSRVDRPGAVAGADMADARDALEAAGIPCYLDLSELPEAKDTSPRATHVWRLMVPGNLNQHATSVLERDIFNSDFEADWKTLLETLPDEQLREMTPEVAFCGLFDRVERVTRAYDEEIARRNLHR